MNETNGSMEINRAGMTRIARIMLLDSCRRAKRSLQGMKEFFLWIYSKKGWCSFCLICRVSKREPQAVKEIMIRILIKKYGEEKVEEVKNKAIAELENSAGTIKAYTKRNM